MKVRATNVYELKHILDENLGRIPKEGEEFEVSEERFEILHGKNKYNLAFVEKVVEAAAVTEPDEVETAVVKNKRRKRK